MYLDLLFICIKVHLKDLLEHLSKKKSSQDNLPKNTVKSRKVENVQIFEAAYYLLLFFLPYLTLSSLCLPCSFYKNKLTKLGRCDN